MNTTVAHTNRARKFSLAHLGVVHEQTQDPEPDILT